MTKIISDEHQNGISKELFDDLLKESFDIENFNYPDNNLDNNADNGPNTSGTGGGNRGDSGMLFGAVVLGVTALFASLRVHLGERKIEHRGYSPSSPLA